MAERPDSQAFWELKRVYSWLGDDQLALLQGVYHTWRQLAGANRIDLLDMLSGIPHPPDSPGITWDQLGYILAYTKEKVRLQEEDNGKGP